MRLKSAPGAAAFTRVDAVILLLVVAVLAGVAAMYLRKSPRTLTSQQQCMANLERIASGLNAYTADNAGRIPYGYIRFSNLRHSTWDALLDSRVPASPGADGAPMRRLVCPADVLAKADWAEANTNLDRRTYSMSHHDMAAGNWPPSSSNATGAGLWWNFGPKGELMPDARVYDYEATNRQAAVTLSMILEPASVMSLGEQAYSNNLARLSSRSTIGTTFEHLEKGALPSPSLHEGGFNYLKFDGSVQLLLPEQTVGHVGKAGRDPKTHLGLWSLKPGD